MKGLMRYSDPGDFLKDSKDWILKLRKFSSSQDLEENRSDRCCVWNLLNLGATLYKVSHRMSW